VPVFLKNYLLQIFYALTISVIFTNPMSLDWTQRITFGLALMLAAYGVAHTVYKKEQSPQKPSVNTLPQSPQGKKMGKELEEKPAQKSKAKSDRLSNVQIIKDSPGAVQISNSPITINPKTNPYAPIITYDFNGAKRVQDRNNFSTIIGEEYTVFQRLLELQSKKDWISLRDICEVQIKNTPEWLTPYLFSGIASANLGEKTKAILKLRYVENQASGIPEYSDASKILKLLESQ
jgi:hypothetical protein